MAVTQQAFRFGVDEGTESTHGWYAAQNTNPSRGAILPGRTFLLRFLLQCDGTALSNADFEFQVRKNGGAYQNITTTSTIVKAVTPVCWADGANTTQRLTGGTGTFESSSAGCTADGISGGAAFDIVANGNGETECAMQLSTGVQDGDLLEFRLTRDGGILLDTYAVTPAMTVAIEFDRRRNQKGPFPFPMAKPAFKVGGGDVVVALSGVAATLVAGVLTAAFTLGATGVAGTGQAGSTVVENAAPLTGVQGSGSPGSLTPDVSVALTGVQGAGAVGSIAPSIDVGAAGVQATGELGSLSAGAMYIERPRIVKGPFPFPMSRPAFQVQTVGDSTQALTGVQTTGALGQLTPAETLAVTGVEATGAVGSVSPSAFVALTGVQATGALGTLLPAEDLALTGVQTTGALGTLSPSITVGLTGVQATSQLGSVATSVPSYVARPRYISGPFPFLPSSGVFSRQARSQPPLPPAPPSAALTGVQATGATGTETPSIAVAATGVSTTGSVGTLGTGRGLTGVGSTGAVGTQAPSITIGLTGVQATGAVGTVTTGNDVTAALSGVQATGAIGSLAKSITISGSGVEEIGRAHV